MLIDQLLDEKDSGNYKKLRGLMGFVFQHFKSFS